MTLYLSELTRLTRVSNKPQRKVSWRQSGEDEITSTLTQPLRVLSPAPDAIFMAFTSLIATRKLGRQTPRILRRGWPDNNDLYNVPGPS